MFRFFRKGFTLVELMIVIAIIGILAAVLFPSLTSYLQRGRDTATQANIIKVASIISDYLQNKGNFYGMITGIPTFYCIRLGDTGSGQCSITNGSGIIDNLDPLMDIDPLIQFTLKDFTVQSIGSKNPLLMKVAPSDPTPHANRLFSGSINITDKNQYVLHWSIPGISDAPPGITIVEGCKYLGAGTIDCAIKYDTPLADKRCAPGIMRHINWDNDGYTTCHILITY